MVITVEVEDFLNTPGVIFDVRSPGEYLQGHIPGSINLPLFTDEERAAVGTVYKQQGKQDAIALGLKLVGPKMATLAATAQHHAGTLPAKVHCWRGGMRSAAAAWLLQLVGIPTTLLPGGYKTFRHWVLSHFEHPYHFIVLSGMTGCGKTALLHALKALGQQVLDLEAIACHRGSSYGAIDMPLPQPSTEQFENEIASILASFNTTQPIWVEDESRLIGTCHIPKPLFSQLRQAPWMAVEASLEMRLQRLVADYGTAPVAQLTAATQRIGKRLGSQRLKEALEHINNSHFGKAVSLLLDYYDNTYKHSKKDCVPIASIDTSSSSMDECAKKLIKKLYCGPYETIRKDSHSLPSLLL